MSESHVFDGQNEFDSTEYIFLSVEFSDKGKTYYYRTEDENIKRGDFVEVTVQGFDRKVVKIVNVEKFSKDQVPMPLDEVKHIICKVDGKNIVIKDDTIAAHKYSSNNKPALLKDKKCGCFYCLKIFEPKEIEEYIEDDNELDRYGTAICPYCGIDSVISESSGYPITEDFLRKMYRCWF